MKSRIVVDTSVFTAALIGPQGPNREILRRCLLGKYKPLLSNALFSEYEGVSARDSIIERCPVGKDDIRNLLEAFCSVAEWVQIFYLELATASNARWIATNNVRDFAKAELRFPEVQILTPEQILTED